MIQVQKISESPNRVPDYTPPHKTRNITGDGGGKVVGIRSGGETAVKQRLPDTAVICTLEPWLSAWDQSSQ